MEKRKNNKGIIILLVVIIIILSVLCVLFATGTIGFKNSNLDNQHNVDVIQNGNADVIQNDNADVEKQEELYGTLGIDESETLSWSHCLNHLLSTEDYLKNSKDIFSLYATLYDRNAQIDYTGDVMKVSHCDVFKNDDNCPFEMPFFAADGARIIKKNVANDIIKKYNLQDTDFLSDFPKISSNSNDSYYGYYTNYNGSGWCEYVIKHNPVIQEDNDKNVTVVDEQTVIKYKYDDTLFERVYDNEFTQIVTYNLSYDDNLEFYLKNVSVK